MTLLEQWMTRSAIKDGVLAAQLGVSRVQVLRLRRGENRPSPKTARRLEEITQIPAGDLMLDGTGA